MFEYESSPKLRSLQICQACKSHVEDPPIFNPLNFKHKSESSLLWRLAQGMHFHPERPRQFSDQPTHFDSQGLPLRSVGGWSTLVSSRVEGRNNRTEGAIPKIENARREIVTGAREKLETRGSRGQRDERRRSSSVCVRRSGEETRKQKERDKVWFNCPPLTKPGKRVKYMRSMRRASRVEDERGEGKQRRSCRRQTRVVTLTKEIVLNRF